MFYIKGNKTSSVIHIGSLVNGIRQVIDLNLESRLNLIKNCLIFWSRDERDSETLGSISTSSTDSMKILISAIRHVVIDNNIDLFDIDTTTKQVGGNHNSELALLELIVGC